ncbi:stage II sporulation protein M [Saccharothrix syringae]|uniref:Stage II sporulation protein M n=1 Tax=Saccharothrix syringae TaxID=103733 RepID=A0A5Q0H482_SACSY|nr:stage II sporulation protein M [Saccharothrix syringae]QFZ21038.1 stage II sporulation protein M [Saccharothrix syringae]
MDIDVFVTRHQGDWDRLARLVGARSLRGAEADELVALYQRVATHLSVARSTVPDPALLARLTALVLRARAAVTGAHTPAWREAGRFFARRLPAELRRAAPWWTATAALCLSAIGLVAAWVANDPAVQASIAAPEAVRELTRPGGDFETYYSSAPAASFAFQVWTNNAWIAAGCLVLGVLFGVPVLLLLWTNVVNVGVGAGLMAAAGRFDVFLGLITPHGLLELTAVFVAAGAGLRLGWTVVDPGPRTRSAALAAEGRAVARLAVGLTCVLLVSGVVEAFVTPSGLPTWARVAIGVAAEVAFLAYVFALGRRPEAPQAPAPTASGRP